MRKPPCAQATHLRPLLVGDTSTGGQYCQFRLKTAPWATGWRATLNLRLGSDDTSNDNQGACAQALILLKNPCWPVHRPTDAMHMYASCIRFNR